MPETKVLLRLGSKWLLENSCGGKKDGIGRALLFGFDETGLKCLKPGNELSNELKELLVELSKVDLI